MSETQESHIDNQPVTEASRMRHQEVIEAARMRHEELMMAMRIKLAKIELRSKELDVSAKSVQATPAPTNSSQANPAPAAPLFPAAFFAETINWICTNPPSRGLDYHLIYYQRYYNDRYNAGVMPLSSDHFGKAMQLLGYTLMEHGHDEWRNLEAEELEREVIRQWIRSNPPAEYEHVKHYHDRCLAANPKNDHASGMELVEIMRALKYRQIAWCGITYWQLDVSA
jgi:hypothetical protein